MTRRKSQRESRRARRAVKSQLGLCTKGECKELAVPGPRGSLLFCQMHRERQAKASAKHWRANVAPPQPPVVVDRKRQARNLRLLTYGGVTRSVKEWCEYLQITRGPFSHRLAHWTPEEAFTTIGRRDPELVTRHQEKRRDYGQPCLRCGLRGEHVCTPPAAWYAEFRNGEEIG